MRTLLSLVLACAIGSLHAAPHIAKVADWTIIKTTDPMSDVTSCVALYDQNNNVRMRAQMLSIWMKGRGGVEAYQVRYDKEPPSIFADRMPSDSADYWWTGDMNRVLESSKLLVRIKPIIGSIVDQEINLRGAKAAHAVLISPRCQ